MTPPLPVRSVRIALLTLVVLAPVAACSTTTDGKQQPATRSNAGSSSSATAAGSTTASALPTARSLPVPATTSTPASGSCTYTRDGAAARAVSLPPANPRSATTLTLALSVAGKAGSTVTVALTPKATPCTVNSIAHLAQAKFYDGTRCHRLTTSGIYVLQCGDPTGTGTGGPGYSFPDELTGRETYPAGTVAMANGGPNTNGSQFFLVYKDSQLGPQYTVFGRITAGEGVLTRIAAAGSTPVGDGAPKKPVVITRATAT